MELLKIIKNLNNNYKNHNFSDLKINSRECKNGDVFFAIKGQKKNGNFYIKDAINNGAKTIISNKKYEGLRDDILYIHSKNPRKLLASSASQLYKHTPNNLIAVTGTNGKTSIADFYTQILKLNKIRSAYIGTLGVKINKNNLSTINTTPDLLSLYKILQKIKKKRTDNTIIEASSHGLHQDRLGNIDFNMGIFTNLSRDHMDYHKNLEEYFNAKLILFKNLIKKNGYAIFKNKTPQYKKLNRICKKNKIKILNIGKGGILEIVNNSIINNNQHVTFKFNNKQYSFKTSLIGEIQIENLLMAALAASKLLSMSKIVSILDKIKPINGRLEKVGIIKNLSTVILDYAHTPEAISTCIKNIKKHFKHSNISILFGCGGERDKSKREIMGRIANDLCQKVYVTDDNPRNENPSTIRNQIKKKVDKKKLHEIPSRKVAIKKAINDLNSSDVLIIAGKGHENYQEYKIKKKFSDKKYIKQFISDKNKYLSNHWKTNIIKEKLSLNSNINKINIKSATLNSREIKKGQVFIGIKGKKFDGNKFAEEALKNKAGLAIVEKNYSSSRRNLIVVKNSLKTFSELSSNIRKSSNINTIGITGSAGKTSLKELIGKTLSKISNTTYSPKSYNNKYGVPLSLFNIKNKSNFGVFEIGMDKKGEINNLSKLVRPSVGIITNISYAHIKNFKNLKGIAKAKSELIDNIVEDGIIILNKDDKFFDFFKRKSLKKKLNIISISKKRQADIKLLKIKKLEKNYLVSIKVLGNRVHYLINNKFIDFIDNLLFCVAVLSIYFKNEILNKKLFLNFKPIDGRGSILKLKVNKRIIYIIDESYNSNPLSLNFSLKKFNRLKLNDKKKNILLGDMKELGKFSKKFHVQAASCINKINVNKVNVYGKYIKFTYNKIKTQKKGKIINSTKEIMELIKNLNNRDYLLVKGSNSTGLNKIISKLKIKYAL